MSPRTLLRLYPRPWRERYADEFLEACGGRPLRFQQVIDIISGAIDARFAPQIHLAANPGRRTNGVPMSFDLKAICARPSRPMTIADGRKGAAAMIGGTIVLVGAGIACNRAGWHDTGEFFTGLAFPVSSLFSTYFMFMKNQSKTANVVIFGGTLTFLVVISAIATWL